MSFFIKVRVQLINKNKFYFFVILGILFSCSDESNTTPNGSKYVSKNRAQDTRTTFPLVDKKSERKNTSNSNGMDTNRINSMPFGLIDIQSINATIKVDLKYASSDNFMKMKLYDTLTKAYLQKDVAIRLGKCQDFLRSIEPDLNLLVYDAVRPVSVQQKMWNALDTIPVAARGKFVSNPVNKSIHNYGAAVDITICNSKGITLDMGAGYDDIRQIAYPSMEGYFLKKGELTQQQIQNRQLLRKVMASQKFRNIPSEWWHFNACSRNAAKAKYKIWL